MYIKVVSLVAKGVKIMTNEMTYDKKYHFLDSFSVFMDIDSLIYILISALLVWIIVNIYAKSKKRAKIGFGWFVSKYMFVCSLPTFIFYAIMLVMSGVYVFNNVVILFLPLVYGAIMQVVVSIIIKHKRKN